MRFINEAIEILQKSDSIDMKCGAKVAELYEKIALFNQNKVNDYEKALLFHHKELDMNKKLYQGGDHEKTANSLNNLGNVCDNLNDYSKALDYYKQSLAMRERLFKTDHPDIAVTLNNIGRVYKNLSEYQQSLEYHLNALNMRKRLFKSDETNPDIATSLYNLGLVYFYLKDYQKALEFQLESLEMRKKLGNNESLDLADSLSNIGFLKLSMGEYESSIEYYKNALDAYKRLSMVGGGAQKQAVLDSAGKVLLNIVACYEKLGDGQNAQVYKLKYESMRSEPKSVACVIS